MIANRKLTIGLVALLLMGGLTLSACNTAEGFGQDVKNTGEHIKDAAD